MDTNIKPRKTLKRKTKAAELERVRNNQRRSRAKRKDYITELEEKVCAYESGEVDLRSQQLVAENELLKKLLYSLGLGQNFIEAYANASRSAAEIAQPEAQWKGGGNRDEHSSTHDVTGVSTAAGSVDAHIDDCTAIPDFSLPIIETASDRVTLLGYQSEQPPKPLEQGHISTGQPMPQLESTILGSSALPQIDDHPASRVESNRSMDGVETTGITELVRSPDSNTVENTTLCSLAFSLISSNNRKGYDPIQLDVRLRAGYRPGSTPCDGCRIDNKILFSVLAEIS